MVSVREMFNTYIDRRELPVLAAVSSEIAAFDDYLKARLSESEIDGLKVWEYGKLLKFAGNFRGLRLLDIGPGESTFCLFLARRGANVVTIDYPQPFAPGIESFRSRCRRDGVAVNCGTMVNLPYRDGSFDMVTCISTIEHLDTDREWHPINRSQFIALTKHSLTEMGRVLKKGGYIYITSDVCDPQRQKTDNWGLSKLYNGIGAAYTFHEIEDVFVSTLKQMRFEFVNGYDYRSSLVLEDPGRANYRGRYFSTFTILAQKGV